MLMRRGIRLLGLLLALGGLLALCPVAQASDLSGPGPLPGAPSPDGPEPAAPDPGEAPAGIHPKGVRGTPPGFRVPWFTVSPRLGYTYFTALDLTAEVSLAERHALTAMFGFDLGGEGLVMTVAPVYTLEPGVDNLGILHGIGVYLGMDFRWRWWNFVPSAGLGFRGSYLLGTNIEHGAELVGRFPLALTWYLSERHSVIFELGLGYGATGIQSPKLGLAHLQTGHGFVIDLLFGTRFP